MFLMAEAERELTGEEGERTKPIEVVAVKEEKELLAWKALSRPFQRKDRDFWVTAIASVVLVCVILFFVGEWGLIAAILALLFLYYVLTTVEPEKASYRITTKGIYYPGIDQRINWDFLKSFYFIEKWGHLLLKIETYLSTLPLISLVVNKKDENELFKLMKKYLPEGEEKKTAADKISGWVYRRLPFELEKGQNKTEASKTPIVSKK